MFWAVDCRHFRLMIHLARSAAGRVLLHFNSAGRWLRFPCPDLAVFGPLSRSRRESASPGCVLPSTGIKNPPTVLSMDFETLRWHDCDRKNGIFRIYQHPSTTRNKTMKFTRRPDLDPQTRIHIVMLVWLYKGVYGKMTQIAKQYNISRTFLYQLFFMARLNLEVLFSDEKSLLQRDHAHLEQVILLLRLEGKCSIPSISSILQALEYQPSSVGYLSQFLQSYGHSLPCTLPMAGPKFVFYLSDEIFAIQAPILVTIDAQSTTILKIELASDRSAETWKAHFADLEDHHFYSLGMASDRGVGLVAGYQAAFETALWVCDYFHEFRELFKVLQRLERKAYAAIGEQEDAARKFDNAKSESNLQKRLQQYEKANQACEQAVALYDQLATGLQLLRETLQLCSPKGRLRTVQGVRSELTLLLQMIEELDCAAVTETLKPLHKHIDDILVPFKQAEAIDAQLREVVPHPALDFLYLAWHHDHFFHQSQSKQKRYHQAEREHWLALAEGLLGEEFETLKALVFDKLDSIVRASSLVEMVNSLIRPYLNSCKGHITQESLNLIMFYHNHRRYKSGKRKGKAPLELLTGKPFQMEWWELIIQQVKSEKDCEEPSALPSIPALQPMADNDSHPDRQAVSPAQVILEHTGASEKEFRQTAAEAA
jgi:hypothetical protein